MRFLIIGNIFRRIKKNGIYTIINIVGLSFGFTCALLIFLHVSKENSYNSAIPENDRVFHLLQKSPASPLGNTSISYAIPPMLAENFPEIEYFARTENYSSFSNCIFSYQPIDGDPAKVFNETSFFLADKDLFNIIQYPFLEGSRENALNGPTSIVLSKNTAARYFGDQPALGKILVFNNDKPYKVTGVVDFPDYTTFRFSMLAPISSLRTAEKLSGWDSNGEPFFKLSKNTNYTMFNAKLKNFIGEQGFEHIKNPEQISLSLLPITERRLYYNKNPLLLLVFIAIVVLIVSLLNYINMSSSLVQKRKSEIAMKKISGAGRMEIGQQFLIETFLISFIALIVGGTLTVLGTQIFRNIVGSDVQPFLEQHIWFCLAGSIALWIFSALLASIYPALILTGINPLVLFNKVDTIAKGKGSKNVLITFQFVISILLVIFTLMINRQYKFMANLPLGFNNKLVMQIPFTDQLKENYTHLKNELKQLSGVKNICSASSMPVGVPNHSYVAWTDSMDNKHEDSFGFAIVSDGYTQTFGMSMIKGNEFEQDRTDELQGIIINETAANILGYENPIGKQVYFWGKENTVIGVVKDFQNNYIFNKIKPMVMSAHPDNQGFTKFLFISLRNENIINTIKQVESTVQKITPDVPFEYSFINDGVLGYINEIKEINKAFQFASVIAIFLAIIGLIALTYHSTRVRIKEIGVRKVNGAHVWEIVGLLNKSVIKNLILALIIATPIAWIILYQLLLGIYNRTNIAWWVFAVSGGVVCLIALFTVSWQCWQAARRNPVEALRYE